VLREPGRDEVDVEGCERPSGDIDALLGQHLEPHAEPLGVELLVEVGVGPAPQIQIEDVRHLDRRGQRQQRAAGFEPAAIDHAMERIGRQSRHDRGDVRRVEQSIEQGAAIAADAHGLGLLHATSGKR
jgi:hypothetical protein